VNRRAFITLLGGAAAAWPLTSRAQQPAMPVIGYLRSSLFDGAQHMVAGFRQGLKEAGYIEGQNVAIEFRSADGRLDRLSALVADLISHPVEMIVGNSVSAKAAKAATTTVPIIFVYGGDPIKDGLVTSINRPGGNVTGVIFLGPPIGGKRFELLHDLIPQAGVIAVLTDPNNNIAMTTELNEVEAAARALGRNIVVGKATSEREIDAAFAMFVQRRVGALYVGGGPFFTSQRERIIPLAARHALPAIYQFREFVSDGGLMAYGTSQSDAYRQAGIYAGRILKGTKPGDLPVVQPTKFDLVINLRTAKELGLEIPPTLLALADEVIE
jgi:putative ABC transport system substrate-binding protein